MAEDISFIHAADLHLDSPFKGLINTPDSIFKEIRESTFKALERLVETAIEKEVDFILLAGDLFDNEKQSLKAQIRLRRAFEKLQQYKINVYLSYGNHDYIKGNIYPVTYPENVFVFPEEKISHFIFEKNNQPMAQIYGFSYENRSVLERKAEEYKISNSTIPFHIAMLHGSVLNNTEHDVYAPFQLTDLLKENFDYWALGHIHQREILKNSPPIVYPGNIQGRNRKETGEKGCYHVVLNKHHAELSFVPLQSIQFNSITLDVSECEQIHDLEKLILDGLTEKEFPQLLDMTLVSNDKRIKDWENEKLLEEIIDLVNETIKNGRHWQFIFRVTVNVKQQFDENELFKGKHFFGELSRHFKEDPIKPYLSDLYQHRQARKYLDTLSEEEEKEIKEEAKQLLFNELLRG
ncbi:metallophosphoesterase family protein [Oceanobacillus damuensis]|uniref:metallophosphoesterase family protein n=1 Tax=Oceanobacillus damuensis TaxID=937928 RepID=UPI0008351092|nr:DNA repair exonuclease [Oceanobacillus damuensis]